MAKTTMVATSFLVVLPALATPTTTIKETVKAWREEEEDRKGKVKKSIFSKQVGVVLERENNFFLGRK